MVDLNADLWDARREVARTRAIKERWDHLPGAKAEERIAADRAYSRAKITLEKAVDACIEDAYAAEYGGGPG